MAPMAVAPMAVAPMAVAMTVPMIGRQPSAVPRRLALAGPALCRQGIPWDAVGVALLAAQPMIAFLARA